MKHLVNAILLILALAVLTASINMAQTAALHGHSILLTPAPQDNSGNQFGTAVASIAILIAAGLGIYSNLPTDPKDKNRP